MDPQLTCLSITEQTDAAVVYLDYITQKHTYFGYQVGYSTHKKYMDSMAALVHTHTCHDIC